MLGEEFLFSALLIGMLAGAGSRDAAADVNIHVGIATPPPAVVLSVQPQVVMVPGTPVYYAPDAGINLFFYSGRWYRRHDDCWYRASHHNGPWVYVPASRVPSSFTRIPGNYYVLASDHGHVPYGQMKKRWKEEEKEHRKHWKEHKRKHHRKDDDD